MQEILNFKPFCKSPTKYGRDNRYVYVYNSLIIKWETIAQRKQIQYFVFNYSLFSMIKNKRIFCISGSIWSTEIYIITCTHAYTMYKNILPFLDKHWWLNFEFCFVFEFIFFFVGCGGGGVFKLKKKRKVKSKQTHLHWLKTLSFCHKFDFNFTLKVHKQWSDSMNENKK